MEDKRIRLVFKDDDILSETQKSDGLNRSWVMLKPHQHDTVSDVASHLLRAFQLHQSCPHGLLLSISGFVLPPFESTRILKDSEIIRVRKRRDVLTIAGNNAANDVAKLKAVGKQPESSGVLLLANEEFEKEKGGYESDDPEEDDEDDLLKDVENENPSCENADRKSRKRKAPEKLRGSKKKKQRAGPSENVANDVHAEKNDNSLLDESKDEETAKLSGKSNVPVPGTKRNKKNEVQENGKETEDGEIAPEETKKRSSRSARRKAKKRLWLKEMAKIQKQNATCESEGLRNWKEDQAKADKRKTIAGPSKGLPKWKKHQADAERNEADDQPKGLLHWKQSPQENWSFKGKKRHQRNQNVDFFKQPNQNGDVQEQKTQNGDGLEQPSQKLSDVHEQSGQNSGGVQEQSKQKADASELLNQDSDEDNEVVPVVIRPGYIRFEPLGKEQAVQENRAPSETFEWNGITSKKKGQQWGKENRSFTPQNDYENSNKEHSEILSNEKEKQPDGVDFDKLPPLTSTPKEGDLIAYRILELSSTWTPELSSFRVGKVSWYDAESNRTMLVPVLEFPIVPEKKADEDEAAQLDSSLYKEDGSLEIDFSSLIDVRIVNNGSSGPVNEAVSQPSEGSLGNENAEKTVLPSSSDKQTVVPSQDAGVDIWDQLGEALSAKKEQLTKENGWGKPPKKVQPTPEHIWGSNGKKVQPTPENSWGNNGKKVQPSPENSWGNNGKKVQPSPGRGWGKNNNAHKVQSSQYSSSGKQSSGGKSWSYKALRGSALGPTMAILRSKKDI